MERAAMANSDDLRIIGHLNKDLDRHDKQNTERRRVREKPQLMMIRISPRAMRAGILSVFMC